MRKRHRLALWGTGKKNKIRVKVDLSDTSDDGEFLKPIRCFLLPENSVGAGVSGELRLGRSPMQSGSMPCSHCGHVLSPRSQLEVIAVIAVTS